MLNKLTSAFAIGSLAVSAALFSPPKADAATNYCYTAQGDTVCIHSVRSHNTLGGAKKLVVASINGGRRSSLEVDCTTASPSNYRANLAGIACYEFN